MGFPICSNPDQIRPRRYGGKKKKRVGKILISDPAPIATAADKPISTAGGLRGLQQRRFRLVSRQPRLTAVVIKLTLFGVMRDYLFPEDFGNVGITQTSRDRAKATDYYFNRLQTTPNGLIVG